MKNPREEMVNELFLVQTKTRGNMFCNVIDTFTNGFVVVKDSDEDTQQPQILPFNDIEAMHEFKIGGTCRMKAEFGRMVRGW
jgi:hypothetical protein